MPITPASQHNTTAPPSTNKFPLTTTPLTQYTILWQSLHTNNYFCYALQNINGNFKTAVEKAVGILDITNIGPNAVGSIIEPSIQWNSQQLSHLRTATQSLWP